MLILEILGAMCNLLITSDSYGTLEYMLYNEGELLMLPHVYIDVGNAPCCV
jgi:hypothetical protein